MIKFRDSDHLYCSVIPDNRKWLSVTTLLKMFAIPFDDSIAERNSRDEKSKWYGLDPEYIKVIWKNEAKRATDLGSWYHLQRELAEIDAIQCCPIQDEWKYAGNQKLSEGVYPEIMLYHPEYDVCGQSDRVEIKNGLVNISDYKSNKIIKTRSFRGKTLKYPLHHLEDCDLVKYNLQLSIYMFMILFHNKNLRPGKLEIEHVEFEINKLDTYGYPIAMLDKLGNPIVSKVTKIPLEYKEKDTRLCLEYLREERLKERLNFIHK